MRIADSHNHLHFHSFQKDLGDVLARARSAGVSNMLLVGIDPKDSLKAIGTAQIEDGLLVSIGIHPSSAIDYTPEDVLSLKRLFSPGSSVVAVGETGFDLYHTPETEVHQKKIFSSHIQLARELSLPIVIHDRQAHNQTLQVLDEMDAWSLGGVFHCFSGDVRMAERVLEKGFFISIPGVVTYKNAAVLKDVVSLCPLDSLLVETDAPFLAPVPHRGKRNEPAYLLKTLEEMARIKGTTPENMAEYTRNNFFRLFLAEDV